MRFDIYSSLRHHELNRIVKLCLMIEPGSDGTADINNNLEFTCTRRNTKN